MLSIVPQEIQWEKHLRATTAKVAQSKKVMSGYEDLDSEVIDPVSSGPGSSDEYKQGDPKNEQEGEDEEDEDEDEMILDGSEEEPKQRPTKKKKGKAAKVPVRSEITSQ
ncbi:hypothetical protein L208DRAFT_1381419 [Tricholoma matsutake]|nr:hypothetical protein L208DRAFT_1381419 [Tricholoma matsutake 945]